MRIRVAKFIKIPPLFLEKQELLLNKKEEAKNVSTPNAEKPIVNPIYAQIEEAILKKIALKLEEEYFDLVKWINPYNLQGSALLALMIYISPTTNLNKIISECFTTANRAEIDAVKQLLVHPEPELTDKSKDFILKLSKTKGELSMMTQQAVNIWSIAAEILLEYKNSSDQPLVVDIIKNNLKSYTKSNSEIYDHDLLVAIENTLSRLS